MLDKEKNKNAGAVELSDDALEQAAGGYYDVYFKDGTKKQLNADGSEYIQPNTGVRRYRRNYNPTSVDKLEGVAIEK